MKTLILANVGGEHYYNKEILPSCFLPLYNNMTIIEKQISLLNINNIPNDKICILCGQEGVWEIPAIRNKMKSLGIKLIYTDRVNMLEKNIFDDNFFDEDVIILEGNRIVDIAIISRLKRYSPKNVLVVDEIFNPDESKRTLVIKNNDVVAIKDTKNSSFPWVSYVGIAKFSLDTIRLLKKAIFCSRPLLDAINDVLPKCTIKAIKCNDLIYGILNGSHSAELTGGSYSKLNYRLVVKKESDNEGRDKLINEINWLLSIPNDLKPYFSQVLEYDISNDKVFYNIPYYGSRNLREHIFDGHFDSNSACEFLEKLLDWMFKNVYSRKISTPPNSWVIDKHIKRVLDRLPLCAKSSKDFSNLINAKKVVINGKEYKNIKELYSKILNMPNLIKLLQPDELVMIHGDLHFQNILIYNQTDTGFILVDPRGENLGSDIYYDLGKLWHSFHAKYDFIHSDQFKFNMEWDNGIPITNYSITNKFVEKVYDEIYEKFHQRIKKYPYIQKDPNWEMKILFAEASHLCSVSVFHIHKTKSINRAVVMYLIGTKLINEFFEQFV